jgi:hypothetical protein
MRSSASLGSVTAPNRYSGSALARGFRRKRRGLCQVGRRSRRLSVFAGTPKKLIRSLGSGDSKVRLTRWFACPVIALLGRGAITLRSNIFTLHFCWSLKAGTRSRVQSRIEARGCCRRDTSRADLSIAAEFPKQAFRWSQLPIAPCQAQLCGWLMRTLPVSRRLSLAVHARCSFHSSILVSVGFVVLSAVGVRPARGLDGRQDDEAGTVSYRVPFSDRLQARWALLFRGLRGSVVGRYQLAKNRLTSKTVFRRSIQ